MNSTNSDEFLDAAWDKFENMVELGYYHLEKVFIEKGDWRGEKPMDRWRMISGRLSIIGDLLEGITLHNDDGSPRTLKDEYAKLVCSVMILGDDMRFLSDEEW